MSDARRLFERYLAQRNAAGEGPFILDVSATMPPRTAQDEAPMPDRSPDARPVRARSRAGKPSWKKDAPPIPPAGIVIPPPSSDLFSSDPLAQCDLEQLATTIRTCTDCRLCEERTHAVPGEGRGDANLVLVGEGPGAREDETGRPFVGRAGELLTDILASIDLPRDTVFICNVVKCRPPGNRKPQQDEIDACMRYLYRQIDYIRPKVILALGGTAAEALLQTRQSLGSLRNRVHSFRGTPLVVTYHPAALLRNPHWKKPTWDDVRIARQLLEQ